MEIPPEDPRLKWPPQWNFPSFTASVATPRLIAVAPPHATASVGSHRQVKARLPVAPHRRSRYRIAARSTLAVLVVDIFYRVLY